jgi:circadian clock protein KaiB
MSTAEGSLAIPHYRLRLIVAGGNLRSRRAIENLRRVCDEHMRGQVDLEIIDVYEHPEMAREYQIVALPTLIKLLPLPVRRIIGDLSEQDRVIRGLELTGHPAANHHVASRTAH